MRASGVAGPAGTPPILFNPPGQKWLSSRKSQMRRVSRGRSAACTGVSVRWSGQEFHDFGAGGRGRAAAGRGSPTFRHPAAGKCDLSGRGAQPGRSTPTSPFLFNPRVQMWLSSRNRFKCETQRLLGGEPRRYPAQPKHVLPRGHRHLDQDDAASVGPVPSLGPDSEIRALRAHPGRRRAREDATDRGDLTDSQLLKRQPELAAVLRLIGRRDAPAPPGDGRVLGDRRAGLRVVLCEP
jgi:hypothetical protein